MWYTRGTKIVVSGGACNTPDRIHLIGDVPMDTVPHHASQSNPYLVYGLVDSRDNVIRYVGITNDAQRRLKEHLKGAGKNPAKDAWIEEHAGYIAMLPLDVADTYHDALEAEKFWIDLLEEQGIMLFNIKDNDCKIVQPVEPIERRKKLTRNGKVSGRKHSFDQISEILDHYLLTGELPDNVTQRACWAYKHHRRLPERRLLLGIKEV